MHSDRFFQTTRGKIVSELRRRGSASAADLARLFGLSPNAVRQQLTVLERDGLVAETSVRRRPTRYSPKPTTKCSTPYCARCATSSAPKPSGGSSMASLAAQWRGHV